MYFARFLLLALVFGGALESRSAFGQTTQDLIDRYYTETQLSPETRAGLHAGIIDEMLAGRARETAPLLLFVAGPWGVGKSTLVSQMIAAGLFGETPWLKVDPDELKLKIPEYADFLKLLPKAEAATLVHGESVFLADRIGREALARGLSGLVDSSMRAKEYFVEYLTNVRTRYPEYRLGLIYLTADQALLEERVTARNQTSDRVVSLVEVGKSLNDTRESIPAFLPFMDFVVEVSNRDTFKTENMIIQSPDRMTEAGRRIFTWFKGLGGGCNPALLPPQEPKKS